MGDKAAKGIAKFFDKSTNPDSSIIKLTPLEESAQLHVDAIIESGVVSAVDVGSGAGKLLIGLLKGGVESVMGIELSEKSNDIARRRLIVLGFEDRAILKTESFLDIELDYNPEAVSMHMVMCCHPDRIGMLDRSIAYQPKIIVNTIPRDWRIFKVLFRILGVFTGLFSGSSFRAYVHNQKQIDEQLTNLNYHIIHRVKKGVKVTSIYQYEERSTDI